ncbi:pathogenesis-related protein 1-like [Dioscorea cayenensis subsp. rotundata]|uniref:Pathogenesis-related protein 1-like n=1 Tax=Dioscorea cayennensis subsp. rotundata TaxID=55577 RepID=A0AB40AQT1_DIOCR|nr:pathogenesis-related protein 1-like [Dioscorea cayenensis subsp. rotundata]
MAFSRLVIYLACIMALGMVGHAMAQNSPDDFVNAHNSARNTVGVGPVTWDDTVAAYTKNYADQRIGDCQFIHSNGLYGENLFGSSGDDYSATDAVNAWVSEGQDCDYKNNTCVEGKVCGHYSQVVWKTSTSIGCDRVVCNNGGIFITCNYNRAGNIIG